MRRPPDKEKGPDLTSMIDVTFLLLIFFIVTMKFNTLEGRLDSALPRGFGLTEDPQDPIEKIDIRLLVARAGELVPDPASDRHQIYRGRVMTYQVGTRSWRDLDSLRAFLADIEIEGTKVTVDATEDTVYGDVIPIFDLLIDMGFEGVSFSGARQQG